MHEQKKGLRFLWVKGKLWMLLFLLWKSFLNCLLEQEIKCQVIKQVQGLLFGVAKAHSLTGVAVSTQERKSGWQLQRRGKRAARALGISWLSKSQNEQGIPDYRRDQGALVKIIGQDESKIQQSGVNQAVKWQAGLDAQRPWVQGEDWAAQWCQPQEASATAWTQGVSCSLEDDIITDPTTVVWPPPSVPGPSDPLVPKEAMKPYAAHV